MPLYPCPCCGYLTMGFPDRGSFEICDVCGWEDDNIGFDDPETAWGPNPVSLNEARANYRRIGAAHPRALKHVRPPTPEERPTRGS
jgi:hypothetical protein